MANDHLFFPHSEGDDLEDLYEARLFEDKQFFTSKAILPSVYERRLQKMEQREIAYRNLTHTARESYLNVHLTWQEPKDFLSNVQQYQAVRAFYLQSMYRCVTVDDLIKLVKTFLAIFENYSRAWQLTSEYNALDVFLSKEPEPVLLQKSIQAFSAAGGVQIEDAEKLTFEGKEILIQEAKRLSLWRTKELKNG